METRLMDETQLIGHTFTGTGTVWIGASVVASGVKIFVEMLMPDGIWVRLPSTEIDQPIALWLAWPDGVNGRIVASSTGNSVWGKGATL